MVLQQTCAAKRPVADEVRLFTLPPMAGAARSERFGPTIPTGRRLRAAWKRILTSMCRSTKSQKRPTVIALHPCGWWTKRTLRETY